MPSTNPDFSFLLFLSFQWLPNLNLPTHLDLAFSWSRLIAELLWPPKWEFYFLRVWWLRYDHMTLEARWEVLTPCPSRQSSHQQPITRDDLVEEFRCSNTAVHSFMHTSYSCFFKYSLLERLFVMYNISNFDHKSVAVSSSITLYMTLYARHNWIMLVTFRSNFSQSSSDMSAGFTNFPCRVLWRPCCTNNAFTLFYHRPNFSLSLNFLTSNLLAKNSIFDISPYRDTLNLIPIVETISAIRLWHQMLCAQDRVWYCRTVAICNTCKKKVKQSNNQDKREITRVFNMVRPNLVTSTGRELERVL